MNLNLNIQNEPEFNNYSVEDIAAKGSSELYNWYYIKENKVKGTNPCFFKEYFSVDGRLLIDKELENVTQLYNKRRPEWEKLKGHYCQITKYVARFEDNILEEIRSYRGIPISGAIAYPADKDHLVYFMKKVLFETAKVLNETKIVCGCLSPENILYLKGSIWLQGLHSLKHIDDNGIQNWKPNFYSIYYSLEDRAASWSKSEAISADIRALALSVLELGFAYKEKKLLSEFRNNYFKHNSTNILDIDRILQLKGNVLENDQKYYDFTNLLKGILTKKQYTYDDILAAFDNKLPEPSYNFNAEDIEIKWFETVFDISEKIVIQKCAKNVFKIINSKKETFILKKYANLSYKEREDKAFASITKDAITLTKKIEKPNAIIARNENLIEYSGNTLVSLFLNEISIDLANTVLKAIPMIMKDLYRVKMFHCDIKPMNLSLIGKITKLFDYDISTILLKNTDEKQEIGLNGASMVFQSPEVLRGLITNEATVTITPFKSDLYSLAKSVITLICQAYSEVDILKLFYGISQKNGIDDSDISILNMLLESLSEEEKKEIEKIESNININKNMPKLNIIRAYYYSKYNEKFVSNVKNFPLPSWITEPNIESNKGVIPQIEKYVATNPDERPNYSDLHDLSLFKESMLSSTVSKMPITVHSNSSYRVVECKIKESYETCNISKYYQPTMKGINLYNIYSVELLQNKIKAINLNASLLVESLCQFIQCPNSMSNCADLYTVGGNKNSVAINTVRKYDSIKNQLANVSFMNHSRYQFGSTAWPMHIAVSGGCGYKPSNENTTNFHSPLLNSVEIYDAEKNVWSVLSGDMIEPRRSTVLVRIQSNLFVIGGINQSKTVIVEGPEKNLPKSNSTTTLLPNINSPFVDVYNIDSKKLVKSLKIRDTLKNSIADCLAIPRPGKTDEIIIFKESVLGDGISCIYQYCLKINLKMQDDIFGAAFEQDKVDEQVSKYLGNACSSFLRFDSYNYLMMPDFYNEQISTEFVQFPIKLVLGENWVKQANYLKQ